MYVEDFAGIIIAVMNAIFGNMNPKSLPKDNPSSSFF